VEGERETLKAIINSVTDAIFVLDRNGQFLEANRTAYERLGYTRDELLSMHISELDPPEFAVRVPERLARLKKEGNAVFESAHLRKDGTVMPVEVNSRVLELEGQTVFLSVIRDITKRKEAELALRRNEHELSSIYNSVPILLILFDKDRRVRKMNQKALEVSGRLERDSIGLRGGNALRCVHAKDDPRGCGYGVNCANCTVRKLLEETFTRGISFSREEASILQEIAGKETASWVLMSTAPLDLPHEEMVLVCMEDITKLKETEEALRRNTEKLQYSNNMKELFSDIMSHDLINPANIILVMSKRLREMGDRRNNAELSMVVRNAEKILGLIANASIFARMESLDELEKSEHDLVVVISTVVDRLKPMAAEAGIHIQFDPKKEAPLHANSAIEDVFSNIVANAIKYSPTGSEVLVEITEEEARWVVSTADRGEGISDEFKEAVFERFKRGGKEGIQGSGLGLAIVRRIVELHQGKVWVEDNPGGGSIVKVILPKYPPGTAAA
jgi:PAS domain S-box-containing protein